MEDATAAPGARRSLPTVRLDGATYAVVKSPDDWRETCGALIVLAHNEAEKATTYGLFLVGDESDD